MPIAGSYVFYAAGIQLGSFVESILPEVQIVTPTNIRHNFHSGTPTLDRRWCAVVYKTKITLYMEAASTSDYANDYTGLFNQISNQQLSCQIKDNTNALRCDFGSCFIEMVSQKEPTELLLYRAGFLTIEILGANPPNWTPSDSL